MTVENNNNKKSNLVPANTPLPMSDQDLLYADTDSLTTEQLERRLRILDLKIREASYKSALRGLHVDENKEKDKEAAYKDRGRAIADKDNAQKQAQERCTHRKGGNGLDGVVSGQGDDAQFSVIKHRMLWGDVWVHCTRCGRDWKPPLKRDHTANGKFNETSYQIAYKEYQQALAFPTRNQMSSSGQFQFTPTQPGVDAKETIRELMNDSTLM